MSGGYAYGGSSQHGGGSYSGTLSSRDSMAEFELMSAELLGGAPLPPMTQQERQQYINGITIKAKFVGTVELPEAKDENATLTAISRVRAAHKANKEHKQRMWLVMSTSGIKILDFDYHTLRDSYALTQISYVTTLPSNRRVFAFVTANNTVMPPVYKCHVFKSNSRSLLIAQTMGRCFSIALEAQRAEAQRLQGRRQQVSPRGPVSHNGSVYSPSSHAMTRSRPGSSAPRTSGPGSSSFSAVVEAIRHRCAVFLPDEDQHAIDGSLDRLTQLYEMAQHKVEDAERRVNLARAQNRASQRQGHY